MRKVKEVLRLRFELGFGQRQIARSCRMGLSTVHEYLERAAAAGISWPLPEDWSEEELARSTRDLFKRNSTSTTRRNTCILNHEAEPERPSLSLARLASVRG